MKDKIMQNRNIIEGNFISCLFQDITLIDDYSNIKATEEFKLPETQFYFMLLKTLRKLGHQVFDTACILSFINDKPAIKEKFEKYGGFDSIQELSNIGNKQNNETYFMEIIKSNILLELNDKGFNIEDNYDKFKNMNLEELHSWYEYHLNTLFAKSGTGTKIENIGIDDKDIDRMNAGADMGIMYKGLPKLTYMTLGLPIGEMTYLGAGVNTGKSTVLFNNIILPIVEDNHKVGLISNEQGVFHFQKLLLMHVLTRKLSYYKITFKKLKIGNFSDEDKAKIKEAQKIINEQYRDKLYFAKIYNYSIDPLKKIMRSFTAQGCQAIAVDTFKLNTDDTNGQAYISFLQDSKTIFQEISKLGVSGIMTVQLALAQKNRRILDLDIMATAKQISEVASEIIMMRRVEQDEYEEGKHALKAFNYHKDENGKWSTIKEMYQLKEDEKYLMATLVKSRNDSVGNSVLLKFTGAFCKIDEVAFCTPVPDSKY